MKMKMMKRERWRVDGGWCPDALFSSCDCKQIESLTTTNQPRHVTIGAQGVTIATVSNKSSDDSTKRHEHAQKDQS